MDSTALLDRPRRVELLAVVPPERLNPLAESLLDRLGEPTVTLAPETGVVALQAREPVCEERFVVGEVVVTRAEVDWHGVAGWAMRIGSDPAATLAAALCDAAAVHDEDARVRIDALCDDVATQLADADDSEWAALASTIVDFEELD